MLRGNGSERMLRQRHIVHMFEQRRAFARSHSQKEKATQRWRLLVRRFGVVNGRIASLVLLDGIPSGWLGISAESPSRWMVSFKLAWPEWKASKKKKILPSRARFDAQVVKRHYYSSLFEKVKQKKILLPHLTSTIMFPSLYHPNFLLTEGRDLDRWECTVLADKPHCLD